MKVLIIEDEPLAAQRLATLVKELVPGAVIADILDTIKSAVAWFNRFDPPDVVLMDIQLADGTSFEIFEQCEVTCPVIFTTAYEAYAIKAFKVNSIDYILKPVDKDELRAALTKLQARVSTESDTKQIIQNMSEAVRTLMKKYKSRFVIKVGEHLRTIEIRNVRYFYSQDKTTFCVTDENRNFILDYTLEQLEDIVDPAQFFRINRKYFVTAPAIQDIISFTNSRLKLVLKGSQDKEIIVARERVQEFKQWLDK
jgi:DNA-binding LytR/AlgR family response regulator